LFLQFSFVESDAARTLTAIPEDEFYVFTHPDTGHLCRGKGADHCDRGGDGKSGALGLMPRFR